jgi:hypothetical protein
MLKVDYFPFETSDSSRNEYGDDSEKWPLNFAYEVSFIPAGFFNMT